MHENIEHIVTQMIDDGYTRKEVTCFLRGLREGMTTIHTSLPGSKMKMTKTETDPLYVHTWNAVIDAVSDMLQEIISETFNEHEEEKE